jgi:hypothetical protein
MTNEAEDTTPIEDESPDTQAPESVDDVQPDPRELDAREQGWVPKEEWKGPEDKWRSLDEFLEVGERIKRTHKDLRNELNGQKKANEELKDAVKQLIAGQEAIRRAEREKTIKELKEARREAVADGDVVKVEQLDDAIEKEKAQAAPKPKQQGPDPAVKEWITKNSWYGPHNPQAMAFAEALDRSNAQAGVPVADSLSMVETEVKKRFPELFMTQTQQPRRPAPVETAGNSRPKNKAKSLSDLPEVVQGIAKEFAASGVMSIADYIKAYNKEQN